MYTYKRNWASSNLFTSLWICMLSKEIIIIRFILFYFIMQHNTKRRLIKKKNMELKKLTSLKSSVHKQWTKKASTNTNSNHICKWFPCGSNLTRISYYSTKENYIINKERLVFKKSLIIPPSHNMR